MQTTVDFLDAVKARYGLPSDYALAKKLDMTRAGISSYRTGRSRLCGDAAIKVAELLELNPGYVLACTEAERAQTESARKVWEKTADCLKSFGIAATLALVAVIPATLPSPAEANSSPAGANSGPVYIMLNWLRRRLPSLYCTFFGKMGGFFGAPHACP